MLILFTLLISSANAVQILKCGTTSIANQCVIQNQNFQTIDELDFGTTTKKISSLMFSGSNFTSIFPNLFQNSPEIASFLVYDGTLKDLKANDLKGATKLTQISWSNIKISSLPDLLFQDAPNLVQLIIANTNLVSIGKLAFKGLKKLKLLFIVASLLETLEPNLLDDLGELQQLEIRISNLTTLPANFFQFNSKLGLVKLNNNKLQAIPDGTFRGVTQLEVLEVTDNVLTRLGNINVTVLSADRNSLESVFISNQMTELNLGDNKISRLQCQKYPAMARLYLKNNNLKNYLCVRRMVNLTNLDMSSNSLTFVTRVPFKKLKKMRYLTLTGNSFKRPLRPVALQDLKELKALEAPLLFNYRNLRKLFPQMGSITLETMNWTCSRVQNVSNVLRPQKIGIQFNDEFTNLKNFRCRIPSGQFNAGNVVVNNQLL